MEAAQARRARLRRLLEGETLVVAPGVFDMVSARLADQQGFDALYMTGYGVAASHLGLPDAGLVTATDMVDRVRRISDGIGAPLIADADTGYGGPLNVRHTVLGYERAGAAAIQIEDQEFPKRCGHTLGREVIPAEDMVTKIRVALDSRTDPDFLIVARTDARTALGLDEALRRGEAYALAGADVLFIESPESEDEMDRIGRSFDIPLVANMVEGGRTPLLGRDRLAALGFRLAIFPITGLMAAAAALASVYGTLRERGSSRDLPVALHDFDAFGRLIGFDEVWAFDRKYGRASGD